MWYGQAKFAFIPPTGKRPTLSGWKIFEIGAFPGSSGGDIRFLLGIACPVNMSWYPGNPPISDVPAAMLPKRNFVAMKMF
jgi:hypothetical protein